MVLSNAAKAARHQASLINRPTCGGSAKKGGIAPKTNMAAAVNLRHVRARVSETMYNVICMPSRTIQTQKYGYSATHGGNM